MAGRKKYIATLIQAITDAGGRVEKVGSKTLKVFGPNGIAFCGSDSWTPRVTEGYIRQRTGLRISL